MFIIVYIYSYRNNMYHYDEWKWLMKTVKIALSCFEIRLRQWQATTFLYPKDPELPNWKRRTLIPSCQSLYSLMCWGLRKSGICRFWIGREHLVWFQRSQNMPTERIVELWCSRQSPGDLGGFPGNPSVLEGIGEALVTGDIWGLEQRDPSFMFADPCRAKAFRSGPTPVWVWNRRTLFCSLQSCFQFVFPICLRHSLRCPRSISDFFILQVLFERTKTFRAFVVVWNLYGFRILLLRGYCGVQDWLSEGEFVETCQKQFRVHRIRLSEAQVLGFLACGDRIPKSMRITAIADDRLYSGHGAHCKSVNFKDPLDRLTASDSALQMLFDSLWL